MSKPELSEALANAAATPKKVSSDAGSVEARSVEEIISADKYQASKNAARSPRGAWGAVGLNKIIQR